MITSFKFPDGNGHLLRKDKGGGHLTSGRDFDRVSAAKRTAVQLSWVAEDNDTVTRSDLPALHRLTK